MRSSQSIRFESRNLLKCLIGLNLLFLTYQLIGYDFFVNKPQNPAPCIVIVNQTKNLQNFGKEQNQFLPNSLPLNAEQLQYEEDHSALQSNENAVQAKSNHDSKESIASSVSEVHRWWSVEERTGYTVVKNFIISDRLQAFQKDKLPEWKEKWSVTYTTQASYDFLAHSEQLCRRFDGPISISVYAPEREMSLAMNLIYHLRECAHQCVRSNVSWHMVFDSNLKPAGFDPLKSPDEFLVQSGFNMIFDCSESYDQFAKRLQTQIFPQQTLAGEPINVRLEKNLPYPINVLRNVARLSAPTHHVLASDIELYPSVHIVSMFADLWRREQAGNVTIIDSSKPHVYVLPIFEVEKTAKPPETKKELIGLLNESKAIFFHKWVCDACQNFVDRSKWIHETVNESQLNIFRKTQRKRSIWEPLYIGTNQEPLYEEGLSWNGKRDKMLQMFEMCLMNYEVLILDNAFLVHAPGIKRINPKDNQKRYSFMKKNAVVYNNAMSRILSKYKNDKNC